MGWRLFVAIALPPEFRDALESWTAKLPLDRRTWRRVPIGNMHLTLRFLGDTPPERVGPLVEALERETAGSAPFALALGSAGAFPPRGTPRVLWAGLAGELDALAALAEAVEAAARAAGFSAEERPFKPHLTVARARRGRGRAQRPEGLEQGPSVGTTMTVREIVVYRSFLEPAGARYEALATIALEEGPR